MIRKLNFTKAPLFDIPEVLVFIWPLGSKLSRVYKLPEGYLPSKEQELDQVLNTLCRAKHDGVWYFDLRDKETEKEIDDILGLMGIVNIHVKLDASPQLSN